jgi:opacity protein-like surface antigen
MKRQLLGSVCAIGLLAGTGPAAAEGTYFSLGLGGNWLRTGIDVPEDLGPVLDFDFTTGLAASAAFGFILSPAFRVEAETRFGNGFLNTTIQNEGTSTSGSVKMFTFMANGWYDFNPMGAWKPYVGGGLGVAHAHSNIVDDDGTLNASQFLFAYQLGAGIGYALNQNVTLSLDYRFLGTTPLSMPFNVQNEQGMTSPIHSHSLMLGARFYLGPH